MRETSRIWGKNFFLFFSTMLNSLGAGAGALAANYICYMVRVIVVYTPIISEAFAICSHCVFDCHQSNWPKSLTYISPIVTFPLSTHLTIDWLEKEMFHIDMLNRNNYLNSFLFNEFKCLFDLDVCVCVCVCHHKALAFNPILLSYIGYGL